MSKEKQIQDGHVVTLDYTLKVDGEVMDTSEEGDPIEFIQGGGNIIPGVESELYDMKVGESKDFMVSPEEGYGEVDDSAYVEVPREQVPENITLKEGVPIQVRDKQGNPMNAVIDQVDDESVRLDFNHPWRAKI